MYVKKKFLIFEYFLYSTDIKQKRSNANVNYTDFLHIKNITFFLFFDKENVNKKLFKWELYKDQAEKLGKII